VKLYGEPGYVCSGQYWQLTRKGTISMGCEQLEMDRYYLPVVRIRLRLYKNEI